MTATAADSLPQPPLPLTNTHNFNPRSSPKDRTPPYNERKNLDRERSNEDAAKCPGPLLLEVPGERFEAFHEVQGQLGNTGGRKDAVGRCHHPVAPTTLDDRRAGEVFSADLLIQPDFSSGKVGRSVHGGVDQVTGLQEGTATRGRDALQPKSVSGHHRHGTRGDTKDRVSPPEACDLDVLGGRCEGLRRFAPEDGGGYRSCSERLDSTLVRDESRPFQIGKIHGSVPATGSSTLFATPTSGTKAEQVHSHLPRDFQCPTPHKNHAEGISGVNLSLPTQRRSTAPPREADADRRHHPSHPTCISGLGSEIFFDPRLQVSSGDESAVRKSVGGSYGVLNQPFFPAKHFGPNPVFVEPAVYDPEGKRDLPFDVNELIGCDNTKDPGPGILCLYDAQVATQRENRSYARPPVEKRQKPPDEHDYIANISKNRLNLEALTCLDTENLVSPLLQIITDKAVFLSYVKEEHRGFVVSSLNRGTSRHLLHHLQALEGFGVLHRVDFRPKVVLKAFVVPKKSGGQRFVVDGRKLNRIMNPPPQMHLDHITTIIDRVAHANYVVLADATSWFYQFLISPDLHTFFGVNVAGSRGQFITTT